MMQKKNIEAIFRLSPVQQGILYQCLKSPDASFYHSQFSCQLDQLEDAEKWQQVWVDIIDKHASLRTFFTWEKRDQPLQIVREKVKTPWQYFDWCNDSELQKAQKWEGLKRRDADLGFDLSSAPLVRFSLIRTGAQQYLFLFSFHHILLDGWSQRLLFNQALNDYSKHATNDPADKAQTPIKVSTYEQFIQWLDLQDKQKALTHWSAYLNDFSNPTLLAKTVVGEKIKSQMTSLQFELKEIIELRQSAKQGKITLNNLFIGALAICIAKQTNTSDVVFGTTVSGRPTDLPGSENTAGMFINTLPLRAKIDKGQSLLHWLKQLQSEQTANIQYSYSSLNEIQKLVGVSQSLTLFDTILVMENLPDYQQKSTHDISLQRPIVENINYTEFSHYPLAILVDMSDGLNLIAIHQSPLIDKTTANDMLSRIKSTLLTMITSFDKRVGELCVDSSDAIYNRLATTNYAAIHQYIEHWALSSPTRLAVVSKDSRNEESVSYAELNSRANQLAHYLVNRDFGKHCVIAVLLDRSVDSIVSFLAILKIGAAYVPLDTAHPDERINLIVADLQHSDEIENFSVLADADKVETLNTQGVEVIKVDEIKQEIKLLPANNLDIEMASSELAYIIYTSGSSGKPKGVKISHASLINSTLARDDYYPDKPENFLMLSSLATDSSIAGIYWSLCSGNSLVISAARAEQDLVSLGKLIQDSGVTHILCIPSLYLLLLENIDASVLSSVKAVIVAGEACSATVIEQHQQKLPSTKLYNEYGPSEFTVWATVSDLSNWQAGKPIPIGSEIANTSVYVMNENRQRVPKGEVGELYLGGQNLASGYLNDAEKTQQKFVSNPFSDIENQPAILYKTGDLVRYCDDKNLEFIGRADNQIKIRGNRLEPEEVENLLNSHPDVSESVVFLQQDRSKEMTPATLAKLLSELDPNVAQQLLEEIKL